MRIVSLSSNHGNYDLGSYMPTMGWVISRIEWGTKEGVPSDNVFDIWITNKETKLEILFRHIETHDYSVEYLVK